jgi:hypothetical protein
MNANTRDYADKMHELRKVSARCVAGLMIAGLMIAAPLQTSYASSEECIEAEPAPVEIEENIDIAAEEEAQAEEKAREAEPEEPASVAEDPAEESAEEVAEIEDAEVPKAAEVITIEDEAVPMVLEAKVYDDDKMKAESDNIDITIEGMFTKGTGVKAWPVRAEGNEFAAYEIVITDAEGNEIHSEEGDDKQITVTINDPELTRGLEARNNISGSHKDNGGNKDADFEYEILGDGGVRFEADVF